MILNRGPVWQKAAVGMRTGFGSTTLPQPLMKRRSWRVSEATVSARVKKSDTWWVGGRGGGSHLVQHLYTSK